MSHFFLDDTRGKPNGMLKLVDARPTTVNICVLFFPDQEPTVMYCNVWQNNVAKPIKMPTSIEEWLVVALEYGVPLPDENILKEFIQYGHCTHCIQSISCNIDTGKYRSRVHFSQVVR